MNHADGVLYSDGTTTLGGDDKSGVAAVLEAMQCIIENELPHGDIQVCFTIGEETGSYGVRYMDKSMIRADAGYCMDCGGHPGAIFNASPKAINLKLTVKGKSAHAWNRRRESTPSCWLQTHCTLCLHTDESMQRQP